MCHQDVSWLMFKLYQIKGYFSFSIDMSPKGRISVIFNSFELLQLPLSLRVTRDSGSESLSCSKAAQMEDFIEAEFFHSQWTGSLYVFLSSMSTRLTLLGFKACASTPVSLFIFLLIYVL